MSRVILRLLILTVSWATFSGYAAAQSGAKPASAGAATTAPVQKGLSLAGQGRCREALPILKKSAPLASDNQLRLKAGLAAVRCALSLNQTDAAVSTLLWLNRDFPSDPDVLYVTTHAFSDLSTRAALRLVNVAPQSYQAHELNAESLEIQGKWDDAAKEYQAILAEDPNLPGIHYRLGRLLLSKPGPGTPEIADAAKKEFEEELKIDPRNAGAEYVLGELARQQAQWQEAALHFGKASQLDPGLKDAFLAWGMSLVSDGKPADAIPPLERYVKLEPANPAGHYQLAMAYSRSGRKEDAKREAILEKQTSQRLDEEKQRAAGAVPQSSAPDDPKSGPPR